LGFHINAHFCIDIFFAFFQKKTESASVAALVLVAAAAVEAAVAEAK